jgi:osmotically-inducible protein OsmY
LTTIALVGIDLGKRTFHIPACPAPPPPLLSQATTTRKWVTLQGCVHSAAQRKALIAFVTHQRDNERVFDELVVGTKPAPRSSRIDDAGRTGR